MEKIKFKPNLFRRVVAFMIAMTMCLSCGITQTFATGATETNYTSGTTTVAGLSWTFTATDAVAKIGESTFTLKNEGGVGFNADNSSAYIQIEATNGTVDRKTGVITTTGKSYAKFEPAEDGTVTIDISTVKGGGTADNAKVTSVCNGIGEGAVIMGYADAGYLSAVNVINDSSLSIGANDNKRTDVKFGVKAGNTYYIAVGGSKIKVYGVTFKAGSGGSSDDTSSTEATTEAPEQTTAAPIETTTAAAEQTTTAAAEQTTTAGDQSTENTTAGDQSTENTTSAPVYDKLGDVDGNGVILANDASEVLNYVLNKKAHNLTPAQIRMADVNGDSKVTAYDAAEILKAAMSQGDWTFSKDADKKPEVTTTAPDQSSESTTAGDQSSESTTAGDQSSESTTAGDQSTEATTEGTEETTSGGSGSDDSKPTLWVLGDSTVCNYTTENSENYNFRNGWGMALDQYFDTSKVNIENIAISGRSSRDFVNYKNSKDSQYYSKYGESNYQYFENHIKKGDYVLIQFGHNDEKCPVKVDNGALVIDGNYGKTDANGGISSMANLPGWQAACKAGKTYVTVEGLAALEGIPSDSCIAGGKAPSFEALLYKNYIKVAKDAEATPILVSPVVRGKGDKYSDAEATEQIKSGKYKNINATSLKEHTAAGWKNGVLENFEPFRGKKSVDDNGNVKYAGVNYRDAIKNLATYANIPYINLTDMSDKAWTDYIAANGDASALHANDGGIVGTKDRTHLSKDGAKLAASLVAGNIKAQNIDGIVDLLKADVEAVATPEAAAVALAEDDEETDAEDVASTVLASAEEAVVDLAGAEKEEAVETTTEVSTEAEEVTEATTEAEETSIETAVPEETEAPAETEAPVEDEAEVDVETAASDAVEAVEDAVDAAA